jgi:medium-chain acyl-[acyl-carrier-protein] hydrolase
MKQPETGEKNINLFCFPHAGGSATFFRTFLDYKSVGMTIVPIQLPGRGIRAGENCILNFAFLTELLVTEIRRYASSPFALFGHSMGAVLSFSIAERLCCEGINARALFLSASCPPQSLQAERAVFQLGEDEFIRHLKQQNGLPREVEEDKELLTFFLSIIRSDYRLISSYTDDGGRIIKSPIIAFRGSEDFTVTIEEMEGWRQRTYDDFKIITIQGGHFFCYENASQIITVISSCLKDIRATNHVLLEQPYFSCDSPGRIE